MVWGAYLCVTVNPSDGWFMKLRLSVFFFTNVIYTYLILFHFYYEKIIGTGSEWFFLLK